MNCSLLLKVFDTRERPTIVHWRSSASRSVMEPVPSCQSRNAFSALSRLLPPSMIFSFPAPTSSQPGFGDESTRS
jgi:hypothetical protein